MEEHEQVFMRAVAVGFLVSLLWVTAVLAQAAPIPVDMSKAKFAWTWTQGTGGMVDFWTIRCGPTTATYATAFKLTDPAARQVSLSQVITAEGTYFCAVQAENAAGASGLSPEASFRAVKVPGSPTTFTVQLP